MLARLARLEHGKLTLIDGDETFRFGQVSQNCDLSASIEILDPRFWADVALGGNTGAGESYMRGHWRPDDLTSVVRILVRNRDVLLKMDDGAGWISQPMYRLAHWLHRNNRDGSRRNIAAHYDLGNDFYAAMLDPRMTYTCGYWSEASTLEQAQNAKLDLICRKLGLEPGMRVLDIGCGWGSFMSYAAEHYGVHCTGVTISREQADWARKRYPELPLEFRFQDYREVEGSFDRIVSVGMFEHVGRKNHRVFMEVAHRCLAEDGLFLLHTIGKNLRNSVPDPWIDKYIFPKGDLPSIGQIGDAADELFVVEDLHNFGADYDRTLMAWHANFEAAWPRFADQLGGRFYRMWRYYLLSCAGAFRARDIQLWQWVLSRAGVAGGYRRIS